MASQISPEVVQPPEEERHLPKTHQSGIPEQVSVQVPDKDSVPDSNPGNGNTEIHQTGQGNVSDVVAEDGNGELSGGMNDHTDSLRQLKDRMSDLEQRLRQAGLLEEPKDQSGSKAIPREKNGSHRSQTNGESKSSNSTNVPSWHAWHGDMDVKGDLGQVKGSLKGTKSSDEDPVKLLGDRIDALIRRLEEAGHLKDEPASEKPRLPAIPQLHYVEWLDFKNKLAGEDQAYAVEVLIGGAKYFHQRSEEERKSKQRLKDHSKDRGQPTTEDSKSKPLPERIRINSKPILLIMKEIDPANWTEDPTVLLRPFKPLIYHEARIREVFHKLQSRWDKVGMETPATQAVESSHTKGAGDGMAPASSDGLNDSIPAESDIPGKIGTDSDHVDSDAVMVQKSGETVTQRDTIFSPSVNSKSPPLPLNENDSNERNATKGADNPSSKAAPEDDHNEEAGDLTDSVEAFKDLRCLMEFIDLQLKPVADSYNGNTRQKVFFSDLWYLFKPGDLLYIPLGNKQTSDNSNPDQRLDSQRPNNRFQEAMRIVSTAGGRPQLEPGSTDYTNMKVNPFSILAYWVDYNGTRFGSLSYRNSIYPFQGERDINSLLCYPLRYAPKPDELSSRWKARGGTFRQYMTFKYRYYTGKSLTCAPDGVHRPEDIYPKHAENIDSQVVVDFAEAFAAHPDWKTFTSSSIEGLADPPGELVEGYPTSYWKDRDRKVLDEERDDEIYDDLQIDTKLMAEYIERDPFLEQYAQSSLCKNGEFGEDHLVLLPNRVFGFVMKNRKWAILTLDGLRQIKRYDGGFKDLQLPMGHKRTVSSLVKNHFINKNPDLDDLEASYDADLVRGKGKGLIILLHGAPGVGKTSTAETVADAFGKLLFPITCGDLGLTAADVERELSEKFHLAELWDCVLLLDEADVFLAKRMNTDIKRNSLVSVFLRVLEHFTGVLFLTTNRVGAFDEAFKSRIHISLYYPPLDAEMTRDIWKMNLERLSKKKQRRNETMLFNEKEIFAYAQNHYNETVPRGANWNGRQIRNAFQTATALAEFEAYERNKKLKARSAETGEAFVPTDPELKIKHFREIASASYAFDEYISETRGATDAEIALRESQRMDDYRPSRRLASNRERQPMQARGVPALGSVPNYGSGPRAQGRAAPAGQISSGVRTSVAFTHDASEGQEPDYDQQPARRPTKPVNAYGAPSATAVSRSERLSAVRSRPKPVQQPSSYAVHDRERRRLEVFDQHESHYEDGYEQEPEYEQSYEGALSQPTSTYAQYEDANQREASPRHRQVGDHPAKVRKPPVFADVEDPEDDGYGFNE